MKYRIGNRLINAGSKPFVIAEIGTNHDRIFSKAVRLIEMASRAGADAIKFQVYESYDIVNPFIRTQEYKFDRWYSEPFVIDVFEKHLKTPKEWLPKLSRLARSKGLLLIAAVHSIFDAEFVLSLGFDALKIASMELNNTYLLKKLCRITRKPVILSSGMSFFPEIKKSVEIFTKAGKPAALLHCVSAYPPRSDQMHLSNILYFRRQFDIPIGYSDHCPTNESAIAAVALGAMIIEKHITLNSKSAGPDHPFALEERGLQELTRTVVNVHQAIGFKHLLKKCCEGYLQFIPPSAKELQTRVLARKSVVAKNYIPKGEVFTLKNITLTRPGSGILPEDFERLLGKRAKRDLQIGQVVAWNSVR